MADETTNPRNQASPGNRDDDDAAAAQAMRILQLECIIAAKDRELDVVRREYAGLGVGGGGSGGAATADNAADNAALGAENDRLKRRVAELEGRVVLLGGNDDNNSNTNNSNPIARALLLSRELERLLQVAADGTSAAGASGAAAPAAGPAAPHHPPATAGQVPVPRTHPSVPQWLQLSSAGIAAGPAGAATGAPDAPHSTRINSPRSHQEQPSSQNVQIPSTPLTAPQQRVVALNVSGVPMDALAVALTRVAPPDSRLARMFACLETPSSPGVARGGGEEEREKEDRAPSPPALPLDSHGRVFLPYPPDCFAAVLELLHLLSWWPSAGQQQQASDASSAAAPAPAPPPRALPPAWWRDRVAPGREPILRQLIVELGLEPLMCGPGAYGPGAGAHATGGGGAGFGGGTSAAAAATPHQQQHPQSVGNMYVRLAALDR